MQVERLDNEILVRIPMDQDSEKLQEILDLLRYAEEFTNQSSNQSRLK